MPDKITSFRGPYAFLSNFHRCSSLVYRGNSYRTSEHAFQAAKTTNEPDRKKIQDANLPEQAKRLGKRVKLRAGWEDEKLSVMAEILEAKFKDPGLKKLLLATGDAELVEGNDWRDKFWGVCRGEGENWLGELLMALREKLKEQEQGQEAPQVSSPGRWWFSCPKFTVSLTLDPAGVITEAAPVIQKFVGQHRDNLTRWAGRFGEVRWERFRMVEVSPGVRSASMSNPVRKGLALGSGDSSRSAPDIPATGAQIRKLCVMIRAETGEWCSEDTALAWVQDTMEFGNRISDLRDLTNGLIRRCFEELGGG